MSLALTLGTLRRQRSISGLITSNGIMLTIPACAVNVSTAIAMMISQSSLKTRDIVKNRLIKMAAPFLLMMLKEKSGFELSRKSLISKNCYNLGISLMKYNHIPKITQMNLKRQLLESIMQRLSKKILIN